MEEQESSANNIATEDAVVDSNCMPEKWTTRHDILLLRSIVFHRPIGPSANFNIMACTEAIRKTTGAFFGEDNYDYEDENDGDDEADGGPAAYEPSGEEGAEDVAGDHPVNQGDPEQQPEKKTTQSRASVRNAADEPADCSLKSHAHPPSSESRELKFRAELGTRKRNDFSGVQCADIRRRLNALYDFEVLEKAENQYLKRKARSGSNSDSEFDSETGPDQKSPENLTLPQGPLPAELANPVDLKISADEGEHSLFSGEVSTVESSSSDESEASEEQRPPAAVSVAEPEKKKKDPPSKPASERKPSQAKVSSRARPRPESEARSEATAASAPKRARSSKPPTSATPSRFAVPSAIPISLQIAVDDAEDSLTDADSESESKLRESIKIKNSSAVKSSNSGSSRSFLASLRQKAAESSAINVDDKKRTTPKEEKNTAGQESTSSDGDNQSKKNDDQLKKDPKNDEIKETDDLSTISEISIDDETDDFTTPKPGPLAFPENVAKREEKKAYVRPSRARPQQDTSAKSKVRSQPQSSRLPVQKVASKSANKSEQPAKRMTRSAAAAAAVAAAAAAAAAVVALATSKSSQRRQSSSSSSSSTNRGSAGGSQRSSALATRNSGPSASKTKQTAASGTPSLQKSERNSTDVAEVVSNTPKDLAAVIPLDVLAESEKADGGADTMLPQTPDLASKTLSSRQRANANSTKLQVSRTKRVRR